MKKLIHIVTFFLLIFVTSCASEKFNASPLSSSLSEGGNLKNLEKKLEGSMLNNLNASEITNLIATFPNFKNEQVNKEVSKLKTSIQNYLYAFEAYNIQGKNRYLKQIQSSYKKIQNLRNKLDPDEDELMNRFLVKIKTNIAQLESQPSTKP